MAASLKGKRTPITTPPYQVPSVDITSDPPIFLLVTTFKNKNIAFIDQKNLIFFNFIGMEFLVIKDLDGSGTGVRTHSKGLDQDSVNPQH
jgi:hypothetical protein